MKLIRKELKCLFNIVRVKDDGDTFTLIKDSSLVDEDK